MLIRAQEMARYVADGVLDAGLTGLDWIAEHAAGVGNDGVVEPIADLVYAKQSFGKVRWVLAVPEDSPFQRAARISRARRSPPNSCAPPRRTSEAGRERQRRVLVGRHRGEAAVLADAIVEVTETGSSLRANRLRIIDTVMESNTQLIANKRRSPTRGSARRSRTSRCCCRRRSRRKAASA